jgi:protein TonB
MNCRVVVVAAIVIALHGALITLALTRHDTVMPVALESHPIVARLIRSEAVAAPAATPSTTARPSPISASNVTPVARVTHKKQSAEPQPRPVANAPPVADTPSQHAAETATPTASSAQAAAPTSPTEGEPTITLAAPKNVAHLDCQVRQPDYPLLSKRRGETGVAWVRFVVGPSGKIENVELKKSSGYARLDDAAIDAVRGSSCKPYVENGEPVRAACTQPFEFSLRD